MQKIKGSSMCKYLMHPLTSYQPAVQSTQLIQWTVAVKWPWHEARHPPPHSAVAKNACSYTSTPHTPSQHYASLHTCITLLLLYPLPIRTRATET